MSNQWNLRFQSLGLGASFTMMANLELNSCNKSAVMKSTLGEQFGAPVGAGPFFLLESIGGAIKQIPDFFL